MNEGLKELIEKIQQEGVRVAEEKAKAIEEEAAHKAKAILTHAEKEAERLLLEARERIQKMEVSAKASLKQAARDLLISLRKEISAMLERLITSDIRQSLNSNELARMIIDLVKGCRRNEAGGEIIISLSEDDLEKLKHSLLAELKKEIKSAVILTSSEDIHAGFRISYDAGKSHYDFTDTALAQYLEKHLEPALGEILKDVASGG